MANEIKQVALYIRVSTDQQAKHGDSLDEQQHTLNEYVRQQGNMRVFKTYIDDGISGQKLYRDEFQKLLDDVKKGKIDTILFTKLDRWFRNLRHYLNIQEILDKNNVTWLAVTQPFFNTETAMGRSFVNQSMGFAELEAQMTSERIRAVFDNKIRKGEVVSGKVPLGYDIKDKHLVPNEKAEIVKEIFQYYLETGSMRATVRHLENHFSMTRDYQSVRQMLTNRKYIGELRDNKNFCEPIIDRDVFERVQLQLSKNIRMNKKRDYMFTGLLVCSECGCNYSATAVISRYVRKDGTTNPNERHLYRCTKNRNNVKKCSNKKGIYETTLENFLLENIEKQAEELSVKMQQEPEVKKTKNTNDKIKKKIDRLKKAYLNEVITLEEYKKDREELEALLIPEQDNKISKIDLNSLHNYSTAEFRDGYKQLTVSEKSSLWRQVIKNIVVYPDGNLKINFLGY